MQDRISNHPNRWVLTPVSGENNTYDFTRADDPTQAGTPLNKATFLPDAVASALESATGVSDIELPADALDAIASVLSGIGTTSTIAKIATGSYTGAGGTSSTKTKSLTFPFKPRFLVVAISGQFVNIISQGNCIAWMYGMTKMANDVPCTYNGGNTISWSCSSTVQDDRPSHRMDVSGTTYYYLAIGVE